MRGIRPDVPEIVRMEGEIESEKVRPRGDRRIHFFWSLVL